VSRIAERLARSTRRAVDLMEGLLAFAKAGTPPADASSDVETELQLVLEELAPLADQVRASIDVHIQRPAVAACSPALLHVVLLNLVSNALKFIAGRERRWIAISATLRHGACVLEVTDSGPGIPRELRARVFEPFFRAPGATAPGTGIGLATVERIVTAHAGTIVLESTEGEGTRVRVQLPAATLAQSARPEPALQTAQGRSTYRS
jgi:signal transduction histidine kinase